MSSSGQKSITNSNMFVEIEKGILLDCFSCVSIEVTTNQQIFIPRFKLSSDIIYSLVGPLFKWFEASVRKLQSPGFESLVPSGRCSIGRALTSNSGSSGVVVSHPDCGFSRVFPQLHQINAEWYLQLWLWLTPSLILFRS